MSFISASPLYLKTDKLYYFHMTNIYKNYDKICILLKHIHCFPKQPLTSLLHCTEPLTTDLSHRKCCDITLISHYPASGNIRAPATLFTVSCLATETDVMPWTVVPPRFPFVGWTTFRHREDRDAECRDSISVWGCHGLPVAVMAGKGHRDRRCRGWGGGNQPDIWLFFFKSLPKAIVG